MSCTYATTFIGLTQTGLKILLGCDVYFPITVYMDCFCSVPQALMSGGQGTKNLDLIPEYISKIEEYLTVLMVTTCVVFFHYIYSFIHNCVMGM